MRTRVWGWLLLFSFAATISSAAETIPTPRLDSVFPFGGRAGTDVEVNVSGEALDEPQQLLFSNTSITASAVMTKPDRFYPDPRPVPNRFVVHVGNGVPPGSYEVWIANRLGVSNARTFFVGSVPETIKTKPNHEPKAAIDVAIDSVADGTCEPQQRDFYRFEAKKGQRLVIHSTAQYASERLDAVIALADADGKVLREVHDPLWQGGAQYSYRMSLSTGPWIEFVDPPFVAWGSSVPCVLYGYNLPGSEPAEGMTTVAGPLEKLKVNIQSPPRSSPPDAAVDTLLRPTEVSADTFAYQLVTTSG